MTVTELAANIEEVLHRYSKEYVYGTVTKCLMDDIRTELSKFNIPEKKEDKPF